jgi:hypothetical protein
VGLGPSLNGENQPITTRAVAFAPPNARFTTARLPQPLVQMSRHEGVVRQLGVGCDHAIDLLPLPG